MKHNIRKAVLGKSSTLENPRMIYRNNRLKVGRKVVFLGHHYSVISYVEQQCLGKIGIIVSLSDPLWAAAVSFPDIKYGRRRFGFHAHELRVVR